MRPSTVAATASLLAAQSLAHPVIGNDKLVNIQRRAVDLNKFRLTTNPDYTHSSAVPASIASLTGSGDYVAAAETVVKKVAPKAQYRVVDDHYTGTNGVSHVRFKQTANDLDIDNADFNVNIAPDGSVLSYGNSFYDGELPTASTVTKRAFADPVTAVKGVSNALALNLGTDGASAKPVGSSKETYALDGLSQVQGEPTAKLVYLINEDKKPVLTWRVETDLADDWLVSYIDAETSKNIQAVVNYKADAQYEVFPWGINDPDEGGRVTVTDPWDTKASKFGWQGDGSKTYTVTQGNNGIAQANYDGDDSSSNDYRPDSKNGNFVYPLDLSATDPKTNVDASVTQLWYTANSYHDLLYELGFTEAAGNFETNNNGLGGQGNDAVILNAQDGSGTNNANFATPPDGQPGRMRMFIWDETTPKRDCTFEAGVVIHEYTHGVSNRLTGGPANSNCLNALESGGMGEGWGDFMATAIRVNTSDTRNTNYPMGAWIYGNPAGIRSHLYSTSMTTNPYTYKTLDSQNEVHAIGEVFANMLYEVMWNIIDKKGNTDATRPTLDSKGIPTDGRFQTMKIVIDGMALQPCNPNFIQARDAILDADKTDTGGSNACSIWTAFAKRGLGKNAKKGLLSRTEDFTVPSGVC